MGSDSLLVMTLALLPMVTATALWWSVVRRGHDELSDCLASSWSPPSL